MWYKVSRSDQNHVVCSLSLIDPSCQRTHGSCLVCFCFDDRWGGFVCANNPICSEVDPVFWLVKSLKPHNDDSQSGPWLTEEVRGTHQLLPMNHKERISKKITYLWRNRIRKKTLQRQGGSVGSHHEERSCWRRNRRWSSPLLNFWWQGQFQLT